MSVDFDETATVTNRYAIHRVIGSGGSATVHIGKLLGVFGFQRAVAIKRLHSSWIDDRVALDMFIDEARLTARLKNINIVSTIDIATHEGELFVIMDYVHGEALSRLLSAAVSREKPIPPAVARAIIVDVLHGLHAAHEARDPNGAPLQIIHRDISPQNILVGADGIARVLDFGVAKAKGRLHSTVQGVIKGKLGYMPVEQMHDDPIDRRADLFAVGVVLWELLAGDRLFDGDTEAEIVGKLLHAEIPKPSERSSSGVTAADDEVVRRATLRTASDRFATAFDMARALEASGPRASPTEVADWVLELAGEGLDARSEALSKMEEEAPVLVISSGAVQRSRIGEEVTKTEPLGVRTLLSQALDRHRRRTRREILAIVGVLLAVFLSMVALVIALRGSSDGAAVDRSSSSIAHENAPSVSPVPPAPSVTEPVATSELDASTQLPPGVSSGAAVTPRLGKTHRTVVRPDCTPPYTTDDTGKKHYKRGCL